MRPAPVSLRRVSPSVAEAYVTLRDRCGPALGDLVYNAHLPDPCLASVLDWADELGKGGGAKAFDLSALEAVLPALVVSLVASHSYAAAAGDKSGTLFASGRWITLRTTDLGTGSLVTETLDAATEITLALHGSAGEALIARTTADLDDKLAALAAMIAQAR